MPWQQEKVCSQDLRERRRAVVWFAFFPVREFGRSGRGTDPGSQCCGGGRGTFCLPAVARPTECLTTKNSMPHRHIGPVRSLDLRALMVEPNPTASGC
jgi:hypothetical protein